MGEAENQISDLKYKEEKKYSTRTAKEKRIQENENRSRSLWDSFKPTELHIMGLLEGEVMDQKLKTSLKKQ